MRRLNLHVVLAASIVFAGCLAGPASAPAGAHAAGPGLASVWGQVLDDEERPLPEALVSIEGTAWSALTRDDGRFDLADITAGLWTLRAAHAGHESAIVDLRLAPGESRRQDFRLTPEPLPIHRNQTIPFHGTYDCAFELLIFGGDCLVLYENLTGDPDPVTDETYTFKLPVEPGWQTIFVELRWQYASNNQLDGMRLLLETANSSKTGHGIQVARADGTQNPLQILVKRGEAHPTADVYPDTNTKARVSDEGETLQIRIHPRGKFHDEASSQCPPAPCLLGVGLGLDVSFDIDTVVYYPPPRMS